MFQPNDELLASMIVTSSLNNQGTFTANSVTIITDYFNSEGGVAIKNSTLECDDVNLNGELSLQNSAFKAPLVKTDPARITATNSTVVDYPSQTVDNTVFKF